MLKFNLLYRVLEDVDSVERERLLDSDYGSVSEEDQTQVKNSENPDRTN